MACSLADTTTVGIQQCNSCGSSMAMFRLILTQYLDPDPSVRGADCRRGRHGEVVPLVCKLPDSLTWLHLGRVTDTLLWIDGHPMPRLVITRRTIHRLARDDLAADVVRQGRDVLREAVDRTQEVGLVAWIEIGREGA